ncbi:MAG TPA: dTDP-4-dehydrorhamnose reductase [Bacillus sp. (in: firmicutes)]|uniref:dTDP-4-dehydrorhamnose reductase n=1 Tax=Bacillus litorisediminis TaxID=2922713 RepID=UPI001FABC978|nr:dTDP-4-dehydrorhamnose reductase [Bacillus litorisediminis]HWO75385.1 dTDP-4-dehydrorhamnose reductase [Bacillus sp. (in: firmicutes)]
MRILVTGAYGQLGREVISQFSKEYQIIGYGKKELDITNEENVGTVIKKISPNVIIHTAAYTAVDTCETNIKQAYEVNTIGAANVAKAAQKIGARMFYISTDYVFDGKKEVPYLENDETNPLSIYGLSKLAGEKSVLKILPVCTIIRTSWLYGHGGKNFVNTMLQFAKQNKKVKVVDDQVGSPTYTVDLVRVLLALMNKPDGIYHVSNTGSCSWFQFAKRIYQEAGADPELVIPCTTEEYGSLAKRPKYSVLDQKELVNVHIEPPRKWDDALREFLRKELAND